MAHKIPNYIDIEEFKKLSQQLTVPELTKHYKKADRTIRYWKKALREGGFQEALPTPQFAEPLGKVYDDYLRITAEKVIVIGDVEIPNHDVEMLELVADIGQRFLVDTLIINGDFLALDCFSTWLKTAAYKFTFRDEVDPALQIIRTLLSIFPRVYYLPGNHERRLAWRTNGEITIADFLADIGKTNLTTTEYAFCHLNSGGKDIYVTHQKNYGKIPLGVARNVFQTELCNVIAAHTHHQAFSFDPSGRYWLVDGGCLRDATRTRYKATEKTTHPAWNPGFTLCISGQPYLINKNNADFWKKVKIEGE